MVLFSTDGRIAHNGNPAILLKGKIMATSATENLSREIDDLRKDIGRLQKDLYSKFETSGSTGREKLTEFKGKVSQAIDSLREQLSQRASDAYDNIREQGGVALDKGRARIGEKPVTAVLIAFCAGAIIGLFTNRYRT